MPKITAHHICRVAIFAAIYFLLGLLSPIQTATLKITLSSLPVVLAGVLLGPWSGFAVGALGELLGQLLRYGLTATTFLWLIPVGLRGVTIGLMRGGSPLENRPVKLYVVCFVAALVTTLTNTPIIWLDSVLYGYYSYAIVVGALATRLVTGLVTAVVVTTIAIPLCRVLRKVM
ncbi:folate family ECF transporter S component [Bengtsoniella intestinalis]|uniref:folate family ECF transporter S component n=1 Tax=Bengtsoniella intestinalis TaxID=3073143 RepID=UPI00391F2487